MTLMEAFCEHLVKGQKGQLIIKLVGEVRLCKILVEDGQAVHIAYGRLAPELATETLEGKTVEWANFIAGYPVRKKVDFPLHEKLMAAAGQQSTPSAAPPEPAKAQPVPAGPMIEAEKIDALIEGFIERVGPLGTILAEQAATAVNYTSGTPMPESSYNSYLQALAKEVPDADRSAFIERYTPINRPRKAVEEH